MAGVQTETIDEFVERAVRTLEASGHKDKISLLRARVKNANGSEPVIEYACQTVLHGSGLEIHQYAV